MGSHESWNAVLDRLRLKVSKPSYATWLAHTTAIFEEDRVWVYAENSFAADWLEVRYKTMIQDALHEVTGNSYNLTFETKNEGEEPEVAELKIENFDNNEGADGLYQTLLERLLREDIYSDELALRLFQIDHIQLGCMKQQIWDRNAAGEKGGDS